jgi:hypothetical protein
MSLYTWIDWTEYRKYLKREEFLLSSYGCTKSVSGRALQVQTPRPGLPKCRVLRGLLSFSGSHKTSPADGAGAYSAGPADTQVHIYAPSWASSLSGAGKHLENKRA